MTAITIHLDEDEVYACRFHLADWTSTPQDGPLTRSMRKLLDALPSERVEPKAGDKCIATSESLHNTGVRTIRAVHANGSVWLDNVTPQGTTYTAEEFAQNFEVLS